MKIIERYPKKSWDWYYISLNPNLTMEIIEKHIDKSSFDQLSVNKFTLENIQLKKKVAYWILEGRHTYNKAKI